jgi:hypothetical protein
LIVTVVVGPKFEPVTTIVKGVPAVELVGLKLLIVGGALKSLLSLSAETSETSAKHAHAHPINASVAWKDARFKVSLSPP